MVKRRTWGWLAAVVAAAGVSGGCDGGSQLTPGDFSNGAADAEAADDAAAAVVLEPDTSAAPEQSAEVDADGRPATPQDNPPQAASAPREAASPEPAGRSSEAEQSAADAAPAPPSATPTAAGGEGGDELPLPGAQRESIIEIEPSEVPAAPADAGEVAPEVESDALLIDAMVGQIRGRPVYARTIFRHIGEDVLESLGRNHPPHEFRRQVQELIFAEVQSRVIEALILAEAERDLGRQERQQLRAFMEKERERILAKHLGSPALAERALQQERGHGLDRELERRRQGEIIDRYVHLRIRSQVVVNRRDVERYYRDNYDRFNRLPTVTIRVMMVRDADKVETVDGELEAGEPFAEVAGRHSDLRPRDGGMVHDFNLSSPLDQFSEFSWSELNEAIRELEVGERTPAVQIDSGHAWAKLEKMEGGESGSIKDVFLDIEHRLFASEFNRLQQRHMEELMRDGNYTPIDQMTSALVEIALSRYGRRE